MAGGAAGGFVTRAFESLLKECSSTKKHPELQKALQTYIDVTKGVNQIQQATPAEASQAAPSAEDESTLDSEAGAVARTEADQSQKAEHVIEEPEPSSRPKSGNITAILAHAGHTLEGADAELVLKPLRLAFETKNLKILEPALDCLHKLIAYDHLEGDPGLNGGKNVPLFTEILNMVCSSIDNSSPDSTILQVLKVLLTAVASAKFRVHGEPLLGVIRVCYNIALNSKSPINQATAKAMLTQMISIILRRMETDQVEFSSGSGVHSEEASSENLNTKIEEASKGDSNDKEMTLGDALSQIKDASPTSLEELQTLAGGADIKGLEAVLDKAVHIEDGEKIIRGIDLESMGIAQRDALLVFRTLCKMGMKEDSDEVTTKTRILSLELLQGLLEGVSHSFTKNFHFIDSVKAYLSYALLRASVSQSPVIFQYATGIFSVLLLRFRESLKGEIGIFFPLIVLRPLDGSEFPVNLKLSVLRMLEKVSKDPQMLVDIFVNYDCDLEAPNLFERMVTSLSKIAQGIQNTDPNSVAVSQSSSIKGSSLQGLVNVLKSLVDWEKSHKELEKLRNSNLHEGVSAGDSVEIRSRDDVTSDFEKAKAHKTTLEAAVAEFNRKPVKGVEYLISNKLAENTPASVAQFLKTTPNLDKATIGDYLGQHEEFPLAVMHAYVDFMNFSGMKFDSAIREFLKGFRLPGEAQKIDRIMEKFAERYCADNPGLFKNADTAYVLAYAVILLNTDAHNPMVWPKMSKSDFIRMNAMNDAEECAPTEMLEDIYDSIVKEEIKMKEDASLMGKSSRQKPENEEGRLVSILNLALPKRMSSVDAKAESEEIVKKTQAIFRNKGVKKGVFYTSQQIELVRPMVEAVGWPLLATFSVTMEEGENKPRVLLCMEGFKAGIHITYVLGMDTMRYAFLTSLVRFTFLHAPKEMRSKNVEAMRTLLVLCDSNTDALQDTWNAVLECVSRLEFIVSTPAISSTVMLGSNQISKDAVVQSLKELAGKPAEKVFVNSVKLPGDSVVEFFTALCGVSAEELKQTPARVFSLQKLVEISYYNMARIRMDALNCGNCNRVRILMRLMTVMMCSKVLQPSSLVVVFETLLSSAATTVDEEKGNPSWQPCADFYITCILSCLPWGGAELMEQVPEEIEGVMFGIEAYLSIRRHNSDTGLSFFDSNNETERSLGDKRCNILNAIDVLRRLESERPLSEINAMDFLEDLWDRVKSLSSNGWKVDSVPRPHLSFEAQLVSGKSHELGPISCPNIPDPPPIPSGIAYGKQRHEAELKYPQRIRRLNIFPPSKTEDLQPIDRFVMEEYLLDVLLFFNGCRKECASFMAGLPVPFRYEYLMAETIFSQLLMLPQPPFKPIYYTLVIIDLCKALPGAFPAVVAGAVRALFEKIADLDMECRIRLILWFSHHLSNFQFIWPWEEWAYVLDLPKWAPQRVFVQEVLDREVRLSYWDKVKQSIENAPGLEELLPPKGGPNFKYGAEDDKENSEHVLSGELNNMVKGRVPIREIIAWIDENVLPNNGLEVTLRVTIQTLLNIGSKSFTHLITVLERYGQVIAKVCPDQDKQVMLIAEVSSLWKSNTQMTAIAIDRMMGYRLVSNLAIVRWVFSPENIEQFHTSDRPWEVLRNAVSKTFNRISDLRKEILSLKKSIAPAVEAAKEAKAELDAAESKLTLVDGEPVLGENPVRLNRLKSRAEKAKEEVVSLQESLEAKEALLARAADENEALFLSLYKSFSNVLMERLPEASAAQTLHELKSMHVDEMAVGPEEKSAMDVDDENQTHQNSQSNGGRTKNAYNVGEKEQWCITTLGYVKAFSRQYAAEIWPHIEKLDAEVLTEDTHPLFQTAVYSGLRRPINEA